MRVLIDACLPVQLKRHLAGHDVKTAREMGWQKEKNGDLLRLAQTQFDVFITMDKSMPSQQYLAQFNLAVIIVRSSSNRLKDLLPLAPQLTQAIDQARKGGAMTVPGVSPADV